MLNSFFCESCANRVDAEGGVCPICRTNFILMVMHVFT